MAFKATFTSYDGKVLVVTDTRGDWKIYAYPNQIPDGITAGTNVEFEYEEKQGQKGKFKVLKSITVVGAMGVPTAGAAASRAAAPAINGGGATDKDEMIYICGVTNQYVSNTGDTALKSLVEVGLRAREAFQVVFRGKRLAPQPSVPNDSLDLEADRDAPF